VVYLDGVYGGGGGLRELKAQISGSLVMAVLPAWAQGCAAFLLCRPNDGFATPSIARASLLPALLGAALAVAIGTEDTQSILALLIVFALV